MTYRDDHDAALARADALEKELADAQAEHQRDEAKIAELEAKLRARGKPPARPTPPRPDRPRKRWWIGAAVAAGGLAVGGVVVAIAVRHWRTEQQRIANGWD